MHKPTKKLMIIFNPVDVKYNHHYRSIFSKNYVFILIFSKNMKQLRFNFKVYLNLNTKSYIKLKKTDANISTFLCLSKSYPNVTILIKNKFKK